MKKIIYGTLFLAIVGIGLYSCKKDIVDDEINSNNSQNHLAPPIIPKLENRRLVFKDSADFNNYLLWIFHNQNKPEKIHIINKNLGFVSMNEIFEKGLSLLEKSGQQNIDFIENYKNVFYPVEFDNSIIYELQAPYILSYCANEDGVYQVGDKIFRISYDYLYTIVDGDEKKLELIIDATNGEINIEGVIVASTKGDGEKWNLGLYSYRASYFDD